MKNLHVQPTLPTQPINPVSDTKRIKLFASLLLVPLAALLLQGCANTKMQSGRPIEDAKVAMIQKGTTTSAEVLEWFGAPTTTSSLADNELYVYKYCVTKGSTWWMPYYGEHNAAENCDELSITFDKATGKVKTYSFQKRTQQK